ncbi:MAG: hypothetical protein JXB10_20210 [Pirellulales bacterium]|nr:hypothetical protein [Pirellulales bacterium]
MFWWKWSWLILIGCLWSVPAPAGEKDDPPATTAEAAEAVDSDHHASTEEESPPATGEPSLLGDLLAPGKIKLLEDEIADGITNRQAIDNYRRFVRYANGRLDVSAGRYTGSELTGNCRLSWYDWLLRHPLAATREAEKFTRELHADVLGDHEGFAALLVLAAKRMDCGRRKPRSFSKITSPEQALDALKQALAKAQTAFAAALAPLTKSQIRELNSYLYPVMVGQNSLGHTLNDRGTGRRLCDLMEIMDRKAFYDAADALAVLTDPEFLKQLKALPAEENITVEGVSGQVVAKLDTPGGTILIGGKGQNVYQLDQLPNVSAVIDLGGNDGYVDGTVGLDRPVLALIDLAGDDIYRSSKPGVQGAAVLGVSMLVDLEGNDLYQAADMAQGSALSGVGILVDYAGDDHYQGHRRVQGQALCGIGILIDRAGDDDYRATLWGQGMGAPLGFALLDDLSGNDHYFCGGYYTDSYPETPGLDGWGQGVGSGLRQVADGGIGVILDGGGDDVYEFDYLAHGGGYWCGVGFARDFGGNDQRLITRKSYTGGQRTEPSYQRFGIGWGCHYALGFCFDDAGDDVYDGTIMGTGMAWDCAFGALCDFGGNDRYEATGGLTQGTSNQMGFGVLFDYNGDDVYEGYGQGYASNSLSYHPLPDCGGNFAFCVDYGGNDKYGRRAMNNFYLQRGSQGGFHIDRPRSEEVQQTAKKSPPPRRQASKQ